MPGGEIRKIFVSEGVDIGSPTDLTLPRAAGGGNGVEWYSPAGIGAAAVEEFTDKVFLFSDGGTEKIVAFIKVPQDYTAGQQITMYIGLYSPSAANTIKLKATTYLVRKNTDAAGSTTNSYASTNAALTNTLANMLRQTSLDLTNASGTINSVAVAAGDALRVEIDRDSATDTDTADVRFVPNLSEMKFYT